MEIKLEHISYKDDKVRLDDISMKFYSDKVYGIIGPSGSGKTYLGKIIGGLLPLQLGEIYYEDVLIWPNTDCDGYYQIKKKIGYVSEQVELDFGKKTVYEELSRKIKEQHFREAELEKRVADALKMVELSHDFLYRSPETLSTGEQRKLALAKALICNPKILILDEPTLGLDPYEQKKLTKLIRMLKNRYQKMIIVISSDLDFLLPVVDNMLVLYEGKLVMEQSKYQVLKETRKLKKMGIQVPKIIEFSDLVLKKKKIKIGYRDLMNDLIKDIYRYAEWGKQRETK